MVVGLVGLDPHGDREAEAVTVALEHVRLAERFGACVLLARPSGVLGEENGDRGVFELLGSAHARMMVARSSRNKRRRAVSSPAVGYASTFSMPAGLVACPFCREMFSSGEHPSCPVCGVDLVATHKLPKTQAELDEEAARTPPDEEVLPWSYAGRGRAALVALALAGLVAFWMPWVRETAPENQVLSGFGLARRLGWAWAPAVAWFVMIPLVASRRSIARMRGARVAAGFLALMALATVATRLLFTPVSTHLRTVRFSFGEGMWLTAAVSVVAIVVAARFGGSATVLETAKVNRPARETLH